MHLPLFELMFRLQWFWIAVISILERIYLFTNWRKLYCGWCKNFWNGQLERKIFLEGGVVILRFCNFVILAMAKNGILESIFQGRKLKRLHIPTCKSIPSRFLLIFSLFWIFNKLPIQILLFALYWNRKIINLTKNYCGVMQLLKNIASSF